MSQCKLFVLATLVLGSYCLTQAFPNQVGQETPKFDPGYSITVASLSEPLRLGSPINIVVNIDVGQKEIYWRAEKGDTAYPAFHFFLTKDGREVETTVFHRKITNRLRADDPQDPGFGGSIVAQVAPGKSITFTVELTKLYKITEPGTYTLEVSRTEEDNKTMVRAKPVTFTMVPSG